ncbi:MAG: TRL-like family protein [Treponema sp.]|nr:TRL-like family protein [Treponema sp.]
MKKYVFILLTILVIIGITGCAITQPFDLTENPVGSKVGEATGMLVLNGTYGGFVDYSLQTAAKNGGITKISTADVRTKYLLYAIEYTTIVTGE